MHRRRRAFIPVVVGLFTANAALAAAPEEQSNPLQVLGISAGPAGAESNGVFRFTEERSIFNRSTDREVIVYFQWQGSPGNHKMVAQWRSPDGALSSTSAFDYTARDRRFGAIWRLMVGPAMPTGTWSIEATVDGQPAGRFTFEISDAKVEAPVVKRPLGQAELYERLDKSFVLLKRSSPAGRDLDSAAGLLVPGGRVYTSMAAVDDTERIVALWSGGSGEVKQVLAWNRVQDWAVLGGGSGPAPFLAVAPAGSVKVGDRCFSMEGGSAGGRILVECTVTGQIARDPGRSVLLIAFVNGSGTAGAPVINEFGELIGLVGTAGATRLGDILRFREELKGAPVVPSSSIELTENLVPSDMSDLRARGELLGPLDGEEHVTAGGFARAMATKPIVQAIDQRDEFSSRDKTLVAFVMWYPLQRLKGATAFRFYDLTNHVIVKSPALKSDMKKGQVACSYWEVPVPKPGKYRGEVLLNDKPVWRGFVRIQP